MFGNISYYHYVQNKGFVKPISRNQIRWNNDLDKKTVKELIDFDTAEFFSYPTEHKFELTTTYPGLLLGSGYAHPALYKPTGEDDEGDFQIGFFFDHTTGLPVIPGSSIKGVLRDAFPKGKDNPNKIIAKIAYINEILNKKDIKYSVDENNFQNIFFERRQVFFEAFFKSVENNVSVVYKVDKGKKDKKGNPQLEDDVRVEKHLFAEDYITPHEDIFKEPNPIRFLKVAPGVTFTFQFKLYDYKDKDGKILLKAEDIKEVFRKILIDFGIGAKRNVGYGQFK